jgi:competence CoiA-like predicted nuclease
MATHLKLPYGLQDGHLVHISQVANGLACACTCPGCDARLIARNGGKKKIAHFAHHKALECAHGLQTALHLAAKDIILKYRTFCLPGIAGQFEFTAAFLNSFAFDASQYKDIVFNEIYEESEYKIPARSIAVDNVTLERKTGDIIPDIILETPLGRLLVEVAVTHFIDDIKRDKIKSLGIPTIEIDLSQIPRDIDLQQLEDLLINGVEQKRWIYNPKLKAKLAAQRADYFDLARPYFEQENAEEPARQARMEQARLRAEEQQQYREHQRQSQAALLFRHKQQVEQARIEKYQQSLAFYATQLKPITIRKFPNGNTITAVKHVTTCPLGSRLYEGQPYSSVEADCRRCKYFRGYWHSNQSIVCLSNCSEQRESYRFTAIIDQ